jgi:hypothetical protein
LADASRFPQNAPRGARACSSDRARADQDSSSREKNRATSPGSATGSYSDALPLPVEWLDALADLVAERLKLTWISASSPWLDRKAVADYLGVPISPVEKDRTLPCHRWEGRVLYHRDELDGWLLEKGAR